MCLDTFAHLLFLVIYFFIIFVFILLSKWHLLLYLELHLLESLSPLFHHVVLRQRRLEISRVRWDVEGVILAIKNWESLSRVRVAFLSLQGALLDKV